MLYFRYLNDVAELLLEEDKCIGCGNCQLVCPHRIFKVENGKALIAKPNACMECGACAMNCPTQAIYVNPDDGCGCATHVINSWFARFRKKEPSACDCS